MYHRLVSVLLVAWLGTALSTYVPTTVPREAHNGHFHLLSLHVSVPSNDLDNDPKQLPSQWRSVQKRANLEGVEVLLRRGRKKDPDAEKARLKKKMPLEEKQ